ncbi:MAG: peptidylprolyl isomerase, partial [Candidatus Delongbacteria bacterium]|nr:peptidylprolyl isomerase [Candidatus Delongbacteria bacterium]
MLVLFFTNCSQDQKKDSAEGVKEDKSKPKENIVKTIQNPVALIETNYGNIKIELWPNIAPKTVANFAGLANGTKEWMDPKSRQKVRKPYYDGLLFHRVIKDFMIQGGCPFGKGNGDPGYKFEDEC